MSTLNNEQLAELRREVAKNQRPIKWDKPMINAALQAIEDWFESNKASGVAAVNAATAPFVFTAVQKKRLFAFYLQQKFKRENE